MSKLTRALVIGATLAAVTLAGMTTVAQAQATKDHPRDDARRPPPRARSSSSAVLGRSIQSEYDQMLSARN